MAGVDPSALTAVHAFIVIKADADPGPGGDTPWKFGTSGNPDSYPWVNGEILSGLFSSTRYTVGNPTPLLTSWRVVEVISTSSEWTFKLDGAQLFTTGSNTVAIPSSCVLAAENAVGASPFNGQYAGIYICSAKLTGDRATMIDYINDRFGLSIS